MKTILLMALAMFGWLACIYALFWFSTWLRRVQVARALRRKLSLPPEVSIRLDEITFGPRYSSIRGAYWAAMRLNFYTVDYQHEDGTKESSSVCGVFVPYLPWLRRISLDIFSADIYPPE